MNLAGFPCNLDMAILADIFEGGRRKVEEAGAIVVGGHTIEDAEPKYGMAVTGIVDIDSVMTIDGAKPGDKLVLTKPLGVGILTTALKRQVVGEDDIADALASMMTLNAGAASAMAAAKAHAATDITGFGLLGHLHNMAQASGLAARVNMRHVPVWPETHDLADQGMLAGGLNKNFQYLTQFVVFQKGVGKADMAALFDPQTSGGLLIAVAPDRLDKLVELLAAADTPARAVVGELREGAAGAIEVYKEEIK